MQSRMLSFKVEHPNLETNLPGKKQYSFLKNRNSKEFSLKDFGIATQSLVPAKPRQPKPISLSPSYNQNSTLAFQQTRLTRIEEIRKNINTKIFEFSKTPDIPKDTHSVMFTPPPIKKICPEKFIESITYTKSDLEVPSKFIPTDRNISSFMNFPHKPLFISPVYTKRSPKITRTFNLGGY